MYRTSAHHIYSNLFKCIDIFLFSVMYINFIEESSDLNGAIVAPTLIVPTWKSPSPL